MSKVHVGMILNLEKETDILVNQILDNLPSHEGKSNYMRKAILYYHKHNKENINTVSTPHIPAPNNTPVMDDSSVKQSEDMRNLLLTLGQLSSSLENIKEEINILKENKDEVKNEEKNVEDKKVKAEVKKEKEIKEQIEQSLSVSKQEVKNTEETKEEIKKKEEIKEEIKPEDEIEISTDTKASGFSYDDFLSGFGM